MDKSNFIGIVIIIMTLSIVTVLTYEQTYTEVYNVTGISTDYGLFSGQHLSGDNYAKDHMHRDIVLFSFHPNWDGYFVECSDTSYNYSVVTYGESFLYGNRIKRLDLYVDTQTKEYIMNNLTK